MKPETKAQIFREGGKLLSDVIRVVATRPHKSATEEITITKITTPQVSPTAVAELPTRTPQEELDYRWECCMKHLGGASVLLREAYERAIDEGIGEGTAEKIMEALNEHSGMEADIEKMLNIPDAKEQAEKLLSGARAFRRASWDAKLPVGGGTKEDLADARLWNGILYQEAYNSAKQQPGESCIQEGM